MAQWLVYAISNVRPDVEYFLVSHGSLELLSSRVMGMQGQLVTALSSHDQPMGQLQE
jgi:hypothetical protein